MRSTSIAILAVILGSATSASAQSSANQAAPVQFDLSALLNQKPPEGQMPDLSGVRPWFNSKPLSMQDLRGHVVLIDFWAYDCPGCQQSLPEVKAWDAKYRSKGLTVIAVHPLVTNFKDDVAHIEQAIKDSAITYPVVFDTAGKISHAFNNNIYPAHFFIDKKGNIRDMRNKSSERAIEELLAERDSASVKSKNASSAPNVKQGN